MQAIRCTLYISLFYFLHTAHASQSVFLVIGVDVKGCHFFHCPGGELLPSHYCSVTQNFNPQLHILEKYGPPEYILLQNLFPTQNMFPRSLFYDKYRSPLKP